MLSVKVDKIRYCWHSWFNVFQYSTYKFQKREIDFLLWCVREFFDEVSFGNNRFLEVYYRPNLKRIVRTSRKKYYDEIFGLIDVYSRGVSDEYFLRFKFDNKLHRSRIFGIDYYDKERELFITIY